MIADPYVAAFVEKHSLHLSLPVDLSICYELYDIQFAPFKRRGFRGFLYRKGDAALIGVNARFNAYERRMVIMHEIVHDLRGDLNWFCVPNGDWFYRHVEESTQFLASQILIPRLAFERELKRGANLAELQDIFEVPMELLKRRYRKLAQTLPMAICS